MRRAKAGLDQNAGIPIENDLHWWAAGWPSAGDDVA